MNSVAAKVGLAAPRAAKTGPSDGRRRYFDSSLKCSVVQVFQGDFYVSTQPGELLTTVLGSCVAACIRDPISKVGGMNHFLLPSAGTQDPADMVGVGLRYGSFSMEQLMNAVFTACGRRDGIEIKVFGGANVIAGMSDIGHRNADFVEEFVRNEGFRIAGGHLRGNWPRKIQFSPESGQVRMRELKDKTATKVFDKEIKQSPRSAPAADSGSIELFD